MVADINNRKETTNQPSLKNQKEASQKLRNVDLQQVHKARLLLRTIKILLHLHNNISK